MNHEFTKMIIKNRSFLIGYFDVVRTPSKDHDVITVMYVHGNGRISNMKQLEMLGNGMFET